MLTKIPQLDNTFVQAVGKDLRKKFLRHLITAPALTIDENVQPFSAFSNIVLLATEKEDKLKTVTNFVEQVAFRRQRGTATRGWFNQQGPIALLAREACRDEDEGGLYENTYTTNHSLDNYPHLYSEVSHSYAGSLQMPTAFMVRYNTSNVTTIQHDGSFCCHWNRWVQKNHWQPQASSNKRFKKQGTERFLLSVSDAQTCLSVMKQHSTYNGEIAQTRPIKKYGETFRWTYRSFTMKYRPEMCNEEANSDRLLSTVEATETSTTEEAEQCSIGRDKENHRRSYMTR